MKGPLVDIVLLGLLVTFFGVQQRTRPQLYFRLWFAGWIFVLISFLSWDIPSIPPALAVLWQILRLDSLYIGGLAFLISFVVRQGRGLQNSVLILSVALPAFFLFAISKDKPPHFWLAFPLILILETAFLHLISVLVPEEWKRRRLTITILSLVSGAIMVAVSRSSSGHDLEPWLTMQVFGATAILFASTGNRRSLEWCMGTLGFTAWSLAYPLAVIMHHDAKWLLLLSQLWDLPKYAVGFAMTLRILEGSRTDLVHMAERYKDLYGDFRLLYENHPLPMWIYDVASGKFLSTNEAAIRSYGYTKDEFLSMHIEDIHLPDEPALQILRAESDRDVDDCNGSEDSPQKSEEPILAHHLRKDGSSISVEVTEHNILFQAREARFVLAVDVTEREKLNQELFHRAQHDALTGLPNRLLLDDRLEQCLIRSAREGKRAVLFTMDIDRFKLINDTHGHLVGDECLKAISDRLRSRIRSVDTIARTGGEEFTAIIGGLNNGEGAEKVAAMFVRLFDTPLNLPGQDLKVSISVGGAIYPDDATDSETLRKKSDQALYHAKRVGRNRFAFASGEVCASFDQAMAIELALREAHKHDGFCLDFQPVYDATGSAIHFEALLRMKPENLEVFPPGLFIPVAEESGLIVPLGNWVVQEACRHLSQWRRFGAESLSVGINVSGKQLMQKGFSAFILETLRQHELPPRALQIELTETSLMSDPLVMRDCMAELAKHGIRFAIDDFGTGYSSLARLADLPISQIKIDRSFIAQLDPAKRSDGIVAAIIHMAQTLQVQVVAEGVENEDQLNQLLRRGCNLFQGFYLSTPLPPAELALAISESSPTLFANPSFSHTRVAVSKRLAKTAQFPVLIAAGKTPA